MATKTEIKKWIKEITTPVLKPYGYKFGPVKEFGNALAFYKKTDIDFAYILVDIYRDHELQFGGIDYANLKLKEKLFEITNNKELISEDDSIIYLPETDPYYEYVKKRDFSFNQIITSKEQLQDYLQPLLDQFDRNVELVKHYKYIPNLLQKWEEVQAIYEKTGNYEVISQYFPSPFIRHFIFYLLNITENGDSSKMYEDTILYFKNLIETYKNNNANLSNTFKNRLFTFKKIKTYFDTLNKEEFTQLQEEFAPFLIDPKTDVSDIV